MILSRVSCVSFLLFLFAYSTEALEVVKVAKEQRELYPRDHYIVSLLEEALPKSAYKLTHVPVHPHQQRTLLKLSKGDVDIHWGMTSPDRETIATAIQVPIFKGLIGKRIALIQANRQPEFSSLSTEHRAMFTVLSRGQVDYFPRSVIEIQDELETFKRFGLSIEQQHLFTYPAAFYFFVNNDKAKLASALEKGLMKMIADGRFDKLFDDYFAETLPKLKLETRQSHLLENDYFPNRAILDNTLLWYTK